MLYLLADRREGSEFEVREVSGDTEDPERVGVSETTLPALDGAVTRERFMNQSRTSKRAKER